MKQNKKLTLPSLVVAINPNHNFTACFMPTNSFVFAKGIVPNKFAWPCKVFKRIMCQIYVQYVYKKILLYLFHRKSLAVRTTNNPAPKNRKMIILSPKYKSCEHGSFKNKHVWGLKEARKFREFELPD